MHNTIQEKIICGLQQLGFHHVLNTKTKKYVVLEKETAQGPRRVYVGSKGAVRVGETVSSSIPSKRLHDIALLTFKSKLDV